MHIIRLLITLCIASSLVAQANEFDESFLSSGKLPYPSQPYVYENNELLFVNITTEAETLRALVPEPLIPNNNNIIQLYIGTFNAVKPDKFSYQEAGLVIPVSYQAKSDNRIRYGNYFSVLYMDKMGPIIAGREIYGYPKFLADIEFTRTVDQINGKVLMDGQAIIDVTFDIELKSETIQQPVGPWYGYTYKRIPSVDLNDEYAIRQIISTPTSDFTIHELYIGKATVKMRTIENNPLGKIPVLATSNSFFKIDNSTIKAGEILHDYLVP